MPDIAALTVSTRHFKTRFYITTSASSLITSMVTIYTKSVPFHIIVQLPSQVNWTMDNQD